MDLKEFYFHSIQETEYYYCFCDSNRNIKDLDCFYKNDVCTENLGCMRGREDEITV